MNILHTRGELPDNFPIPLRTLVVDDSAVLLENGFICKQEITNDLTLMTEIRRAFHSNETKARSS